MKIQFFKISHGGDFWQNDEISDALTRQVVGMHRDTEYLAGNTPQYEKFVEAPIGSYFYLTRSNKGIYLLGQFVGPANVFTPWEDGWVERPYKIIKYAHNRDIYDGVQKWWTPNHNSTFAEVPEHELNLFEELILAPYFAIKLSNYGITID